MTLNPVDKLRQDPNFVGFLGKGIAGREASLRYLDLIWAALFDAHGNLKTASRILQQSPSSLSRLIHRQGWAPLVEALREQERLAAGG